MSGFLRRRGPPSKSFHSTLPFHFLHLSVAITVSSFGRRLGVFISASVSVDRNSHLPERGVPANAPDGSFPGATIADFPSCCTVMGRFWHALIVATSTLLCQRAGFLSPLATTSVAFIALVRRAM